jgi:hypothetical protein
MQRMSFLQRFFVELQRFSLEALVHSEDSSQEKELLLRAGEPAFLAHLSPSALLECVGFGTSFSAGSFLERRLVVLQRVVVSLNSHR